MNWTKSKIYELIMLYQNEPCLWNSAIEEYKSREKRDVAITKICDQLNVNREQFSKKIHNLRNQFNYEAKKVFKRNVDCKDAYKSKWEFYDTLKFLKKVIAPRPGFLNTNHDDASYVAVQLNKDELSPREKRQARKHSPELVEIEELTLPNDDQIEKIFTEITTAKIEPQQRFQVSIATETLDEDPISPPNKKLKLNNTVCNNSVQTNSSSTTTTSSSGRNEYEIFGEFIGSELKNLRSESSRRLLKRKIMQALLEVSITDEDVY